jgi:hypothetical protein
MPHFLLVCGDSTRPVGIIIMEAPSMLQAHTNGVAQGVAGPEPFGEVHELSAKNDEVGSAGTDRQDNFRCGSCPSDSSAF